jgi:hypothetical protein
MYFDYYEIQKFVNNDYFKNALKHSGYIAGSETISKIHDKLIKTIIKEHNANPYNFRLSNCVTLLLKQLLMFKDGTDKYCYCIMAISIKAITTRERAMMLLLWFLNDNTTDLRYDDYSFTRDDIYERLRTLNNTIFINHNYTNSVLIKLFDEFYDKVSEKTKTIFDNYQTYKSIVSYDWPTNNVHIKRLWRMVDYDYYNLLAKKYLPKDNPRKPTYRHLYNMIGIDFYNCNRENIRDSLLMEILGTTDNVYSYDDVIRSGLKEIETTLDKEILMEEFTKSFNVEEQFDKIVGSISELNMTKYAGKTI